jgi:hypothetical protein
MDYGLANKKGRVIHGGSQTKQKGWRRAEVVEPRKRLLGRQARGRAMAQGQGDLVRAVRGARCAGRPRCGAGRNGAAAAGCGGSSGPRHTAATQPSGQSAQASSARALDLVTCEWSKLEKLEKTRDL